MSPEEYVEAIQKQPQVRYMTHPVSLRTLKPRDEIETGYIVGKRKKDGKLLVVPVPVLRDTIAIRPLAWKSTPKRLQGWIWIAPERIVSDGLRHC